ncbi:MAG: hypothetical protein JJT96_08220 [Opitutales bacterium]|nr:hypothetical protein [Opitutales bacterium]
MSISMEMPGMGRMAQETATQSLEVWTDTIGSVENGRIQDLTRTFSEERSSVEVGFMGQTQRQTIETGVVGQNFRYVRDEGSYRLDTQALPRRLRREARDKANELAHAVGAEYGTLFFPDRELSSGDSWDLDALNVQDLAKAMDLADASGTGRATFVGIAEHEGERVARVTYSYGISGRMTMEGGAFAVKFELEGEILRSLDSRVDLKNSGRGRISGSGSMSQQGMKIDFSLDGPVVNEIKRTVR